MAKAVAVVVLLKIEIGDFNEELDVCYIFC
jgi:hypothetical protein